MIRPSEHMTAAMHTETYTPAGSKAFWAQYEPQIRDFLKVLEARETWITSGVGEAEPALIELISHLPNSGPTPPEALAGLMRILSALPYGESIHALLWMDVRNAPAVRDVLRYTYEHRGTSAAANIMWQRLERVARFHVLSGVVSDAMADAKGLLGNDDRPVERASDHDHENGGEPREGATVRRLCVIRNEETLPFLQEAREIASLNEVDELFGNRRFYLLTSDLALCRSLAPNGVGVDQYGGYVTRGPGCDFERLDALLPFVARRSIKPLFGDLIPHSSWASNLARLLTRSCWERLRRPVIEAVGNRCEICGAKDPAIDCHEKWEYHEPMFEGGRGVQRLMGFWAMCAECHATQHLVYSGRGAEALERLRRVGRMSEREAQAYRAFVFDRRSRRSTVNWLLDLSCLAAFGPLVVHSGWTLDAEGFLNQERQMSKGETVRARTMLLGASWRFSAAGSHVYSARPAQNGYYE